MTICAEMSFSSMCTHLSDNNRTAVPSCVHIYVTIIDFIIDMFSLNPSNCQPFSFKLLLLHVKCTAKMYIYILVSCIQWMEKLVDKVTTM